MLSRDLLDCSVEDELAVASSSFFCMLFVWETVISFSSERGKAYLLPIRSSK